MVSFYYKTFARVCLLPYIGGTILHLLRLAFDFPVDRLPLAVDRFIVVIGGYGGLGLLVFARKVPFKRMWDKLAYALLVFHLDGSVILHAWMWYSGDHGILSVFGYWYSLFAVGYFVALGLYVVRLNRLLYRRDGPPKTGADTGES